MPIPESPSASDRAAVRAQLGRPPRGEYAIAARGACGLPAVIRTAPRLSDGTPFPTLWYLTCPTVVAAVSTLESTGWLQAQTQRLAADPGLAADYRLAHQRYIAERDRIAVVPELAGISAGGMPDRVKCGHALVAHSLAVGPGVNPIGDAAVAELREVGVWPCRHPCVDAEG
ncbi:MAG: DUF501 domain-containing protein [Candidatus Nanopelagicales bacterium]|nr:DUF501 domain-containing protein [Candidatus Nanopelagicales bacterium]